MAAHNNPVFVKDEDGCLLREKQKSGPNWFCTYRCQIGLLLCYGTVCSGFFRVSLNMALVCMVNSTAVGLLMLKGKTSSLGNDTLFNDALLPSFGNVSKEGCVLTEQQRDEYDGELLWTSYEDKWIRSSIMYGQIISNLPAGWLSDRYGPKKLFMVCTTLQMICSILTPLGSRFHYICAIALRFVMGLAQGFMMPAIATAVVRWFPQDEISTVTGVYTAGNQLCMIIGLPLFAFLCSQHQFLGGWPAIFYFCSIIAIPWCIWWQRAVTNLPSSNKRITAAEKNYLELTTREQNLRQHKGSKLPWKPMLTSAPLWAINVMSFAIGFNISVQQYLPRYFKDVLYLDIKSNGIYSALPYVLQWLVKGVLSYYADQVKRRTKLSRSTICKLFNSLASFGMAVFIMSLAFLDCHNTALVIGLLCIGQAFTAGFVPGFATTAYLLAPQHAGSVNSFSSFFRLIAGVMVPYIISPLIQDGTREEWQIVFFLTVAVLTIGGVLFLCFGSGEIQDWARSPEKEVLTADTPSNALLRESNLQGQTAALDCSTEVDGQLVPIINKPEHC